MAFDDTPGRGGRGNGGGNTPADLAAVLFFLRDAAEDGAHFAGYSGEEAFDAMARLIGHDPDALKARLARS
jgi:hypothetical protein